MDRSFQIDAAIVRIMKMRRRFAHEKLVSETTEQLLSHFHADPKQIKRRIEHLIERECAQPEPHCLFPTRHVPFFCVFERPGQLICDALGLDSAYRYLERSGTNSKYYHYLT